MGFHYVAWVLLSYCCDWLPDSLWENSLQWFFVLNSIYLFCWFGVFLCVCDFLIYLFIFFFLAIPAMELKFKWSHYQTVIAYCPPSTQVLHNCHPATTHTPVAGSYEWACMHASSSLWICMCIKSPLSVTHRSFPAAYHYCLLSILPTGERANTSWLQLGCLSFLPFIEAQLLWDRIVCHMIFWQRK